MCFFVYLRVFRRFMGRIPDVQAGGIARLLCDRVQPRVDCNTSPCEGKSAYFALNVLFLVNAVM